VACDSSNFHLARELINPIDATPVARDQVMAAGGYPTTLSANLMLKRLRSRVVPSWKIIVLHLFGAWIRIPQALFSGLFNRRRGRCAPGAKSNCSGG
jgi:hypothetical protein